MGVGAGLYMYDAVVKTWRSLSHLISEFLVFFVCTLQTATVASPFAGSVKYGSYVMLLNLVLFILSLISGLYWFGLSGCGLCGLKSDFYLLKCQIFMVQSINVCCRIYHNGCWTVAYWRERRYPTNWR